jgi:hypothetical protein
MPEAPSGCDKVAWIRHRAAIDLRTSRAMDAVESGDWKQAVALLHEAREHMSALFVLAVGGVDGERPAVLAEG